MKQNLLLQLLSTINNIKAHEETILIISYQSSSRLLLLNDWGDPAYIPIVFPYLFFLEITVI